MRRISVIVLVFSFLMLSIRPVMPMLEYLVLKDYIIKEKCVNKQKPKRHCDGKCYLMQKMKKTALAEAQQDEEAPAPAPENRWQGPESPQILNKHQLYTTAPIQIVNGFATGLEPTPRSRILSPPPTPPPEQVFS